MTLLAVGFVFGAIVGLVAGAGMVFVALTDDVNLEV